MNKLLLLKKSKGFTLIEVLITLAIFAIVMAVGAAILIQIFDIIPSSNERMTTRQLAEIDLNKIVAFVREAEKIENNIITLNENGDEIKWNNEDNSIYKDDEKIMNNISSFKIEEKSEHFYLITFEKCNTEACNKTVILKTQALQRNQS